ncbi:MAG TPA: hypothetical protein VG737_07715 [Cyclobacteriaceae bacterium]|nr:hypothetical protein [Cyclobacteriaceae bacterium]
MGEELLKALPVLLASMIKFILGPIGGHVAKLHFITTVVVTILGMMTMVVAFTYFGDWIKSKIPYFKKRKRFTSRNRRFVQIWRKFGLVGVAALTPVFLTPIGGTLLAISSGSPKEKIILYMLISAVGWALVFTSIIYFAGKHALPDFMQ